jgi:hypothetical protein
MGYGIAYPEMSEISIYEVCMCGWPYKLFGDREISIYTVGFSPYKLFGLSYSQAVLVCCGVHYLT